MVATHDISNLDLCVIYGIYKENGSLINICDWLKVTLNVI